MQKNPGIVVTMLLPDGTTYKAVLPDVPQIGTHIQSADCDYVVVMVSIETRFYPDDSATEYNISSELARPDVYQGVTVTLAPIV